MKRRRRTEMMADLWEEDPLPTPSEPIPEVPLSQHPPTVRRRASRQRAATGRRSNASRGAYYKGRTRKWLEGLGYQVADLEVVRWIHKPSGERIPVKRDQFGSDLLAMNIDGFVFVQVKSGRVTGNFPEAARKFAAVIWPELVWPSTAVKRWVVAWAPRARQPRVIEM